MTASSSVMKMMVANIAWRAGLVNQEIFAALLTSLLLKVWQGHPPRVA